MGQHCTDIGWTCSCLLGRLWACAGAVFGHRCRRGASFGSTLGQGFCLLMPALPGGCVQRSDVVLLLGRRPKRWPSSGAALGRGLEFCRGICSRYFQLWVHGGRETDRFGVALVQRRRRWTSVEATLVRRRLSARYDMIYI